MISTPIESGTLNSSRNNTVESATRDASINLGLILGLGFGGSFVVFVAFISWYYRRARMNDDEIKVVDKLKSELMKHMDFAKARIFYTRDHRADIDVKKIEDIGQLNVKEQKGAMLELIKSTKNGWDLLIKFLIDAREDYMAKRLQDELATVRKSNKSNRLTAN